MCRRRRYIQYVDYGRLRPWVTHLQLYLTVSTVCTQRNSGEFHVTDSNSVNLLASRVRLSSRLSRRRVLRRIAYVNYERATTIKSSHLSFFVQLYTASFISYRAMPNAHAVRRAPVERREQYLDLRTTQSGEGLLSPVTQFYIVGNGLDNHFFFASTSPRSAGRS